MALTFGQLLSGAGAVSTGMRQAEAQQRQARLEQLALEERNRIESVRQQTAAAGQAGLQIPNVPQFQGMTGGQPYAGPLGVSVPQAPATSAAPAPAPATAPPSTAAATTQYPYFPEEGPPGPAPAATPAGRFLQEQQTSAQERNELSRLRREVNREYGLRSGIGGFFVKQTDEERKFAKDVLDRVNELTKPELEQLLQTGQLPPKAGVRPELAKAMKQVESGGDTTAVSPKGATGLMQVMPETAMDPGFNLPTVFEFAQQQGIEVKGTTAAEAQRLLKNPKVGEPYGLLYANAMNQRYGGDETLMLVAYNWGPGNADKWASSGRDPMQLPQETRDYIIKNMRIAGTGSPTVGKTPGQTADNIARATGAAPAAASGVMYGPSSVGAGAGDPAVQAALSLRNLLAAEAQAFGNYGMTKQAAEAIGQIAAIDLGLYKAQAEQGVYELKNMGDAGRAMSVLSQFTGTPTQALSRGDGTFDLYQNGRVTQTAIPVEKLADLIKTQVDEGYRTQKAALGAKVFEKDLELRNKIQEELVKAQGNIEKAMVEGAIKRLEREYGVEIKPDSAGGIAYVRRGREIQVLDPNTVTQIRGQSVRTPTAYPVR